MPATGGYITMRHEGWAVTTQREFWHHTGDVAGGSSPRAVLGCAKGLRCMHGLMCGVAAAGGGAPTWRWWGGGRRQ